MCPTNLAHQRNSQLKSLEIKHMVVDAVSSEPVSAIAPVSPDNPCISRIRAPLLVFWAANYSWKSAVTMT